MKLPKYLITFSLLAIALSVSAYDAVGHRIIADIAYQNLTEKARTELDNILGKHGIVYEATWADEVRSDKKYDYSYQWHYQNLKDSLSTNDIKRLLEQPKSEGEHLFYALDMMQSRLKKDKNDVEALKFLIHFMGDLHQPMHLGRSSDLGGNKVEYNWFGKKTNLHATWDSWLIENQRMSYSEYSKYLQDKFELRKPEFRKYSILQSVQASYALRNLIYNYDYSDTSNYHYSYRFAAMLDEMLYRGGIQLANILNGLYN
jgi:S1/P1 Nuclease.